MILSPRKRKALKADREFLLVLRGMTSRPYELERYSEERQYYVRVMERAMSWWLDGVYKKYDAQPPGPDAYEGRDRILLLYLDAHPEEDRTRAMQARDAQVAHMEGHR